MTATNFQMPFAAAEVAAAALAELGWPVAPAPWGFLELGEGPPCWAVHRAVTLGLESVGEQSPWSSFNEWHIDRQDQTPCDCEIQR